MMQLPQMRFASSIKNNMVPAIGSTYKICDPPSGGFFFGYIFVSKDLMSPVPQNIPKYFY